jgi:prolipoprotein diacylglyceryltransferase
MSTIFYIVALLCAVWVIYDVLAKNKNLNTTAKVIWVVCAVFFSIITAIVYYFIGRKQ